MSKIAIIGGTGLDKLEDLKLTQKQMVETPYGFPSDAIQLGQWGQYQVALVARHGNPRAIPPHVVNYRANLWALKSLGYKSVVALYAVGGINEALQSTDIVIPDQIIDYTYGRKHTVFEEGLDEVVHVDFTEPYSRRLRQAIINAAQLEDISVYDSGTYAATQGPRLETAHEVNRLARDGADIVGMTGMPEAGLARELDLEFAGIALVVNKAAGRSEEPITMEMINNALSEGKDKIQRIIKALLNQTLI